MSEIEASTASASAPTGADYFSVFELPRKLDLDEAALMRAFYKKSREVHPDRFANASAEKQQWSLEQTSLLNDAYRTLKEPIARTEYLLRLEGVTIADEARGGTESKKNIPPELLAEMFELNMQLEEMRESAGTGDPQLRTDLEQARVQFKLQFADIETEIKWNWQLWDGVADIEDEWEQALAKKNLAALLDKRRYIRNLLRDVGEALGTQPVSATS